jgi:hypothetical protein
MSSLLLGNGKEEVGKGCTYKEKLTLCTVKSGSPTQEVVNTMSLEVYK